MKVDVIERMARAGDADVEPIIAAWAIAGVFDNAGAAAIAASHEQGHSVTIVENGIIYRFNPDGTKVEIRRLAHRPSNKYRRGRFSIKK